MSAHAGSRLSALDLATIDDVRSACCAADGADPLDEATSLRLKHHGLGVGDKLWLDHSAGFLLALRESGSTDSVSGRVDLTLAVRPDARGRGRGHHLLTTALKAEEYADLTWSAWSHGDHPAARVLAWRTGFTRDRELWVMRAEVGAPTHPQAPATATEPDGIKIRSYQPGDADGIISVNAAAFADHPEQGAMDAVNLAERMAEPWFDPHGLLVAVDDGNKVVGFHWTKVHPSGPTGEPRIGEVYVIGVAPLAHGRGLGRRLMHAGLEHLAGAAVDQVMLYVESDNAPALALYDSLGFSHGQQDTHVLYQRGATG